MRGVAAPTAPTLRQRPARLVQALQHYFRAFRCRVTRSQGRPVQAGLGSVVLLPANRVGVTRRVKPGRVEQAKKVLRACFPATTPQVTTAQMEAKQSFTSKMHSAVRAMPVGHFWAHVVGTRTATTHRRTAHRIMLSPSSRSLGTSLQDERHRSVVKTSSMLNSLITRALSSDAGHGRGQISSPMQTHCW